MCAIPRPPTDKRPNIMDSCLARISGVLKCEMLKDGKGLFICLAGRSDVAAPDCMIFFEQALHR